MEDIHKKICKLNYIIDIMNWISTAPSLGDEQSCRRWLKEGKALVKEAENYLIDSKGLSAAKELIKEMKDHIFKLKGN